MKKISILAFLYCLLSLSISIPAQAQISPWVNADNLRARLISGVSSIGTDKTFEALLDVSLADDWHTYWRVSGDSGLPPRFDWSMSENVKDVRVSYPAPTRKNESGLYTFGYDNAVAFPLLITLKEPQTAATLNLQAQMMVCKDICIPSIFNITLNIPAKDGQTSTMMPLIKKAKETIPSPVDLPHLKINTIVAGPNALAINAYSKNGFDAVDVFPVSDNLSLTLPPEITPNAKDPRIAMIRIPITPDIDNLIDALKGQKLSITMVNGKTAIEKKIQYYSRSD